MPVNVHPDYVEAEREYLRAETLNEKLEKLQKMISLAPSHKGGENLRAQLKTRYKKLREKIEKAKKTGKSLKVGIKKHDMQAIIIGIANTGKSSLLSILTNARPKISDNKFSTTQPIIGMMHYKTADIQLIENPSVESEFYDKGLTNTGDTLLILITEISQIERIKPLLYKSKAKQIIVFNKSDKLDFNRERKISATLSSKKYDFVLISTKTSKGIDELKEKLFNSFDKIRVYTKQPKKEKAKKPIILNPNSTIKDVAEKILKGFSKKIKETRIWGPSSKFAGQKVGLSHKLKDLDIVEFKTH
jgi:ribosome-interacting GTPase 1